mmetsp:Transcript_5643/g.6377  ORF Transcript_5643/g.6377 Transcript_5643/m.6377 type:complete len:281 (+) Transcript_5643:324-1166(+)
MCLKSYQNIEEKDAVIKDLENKFSALSSFTGKLQQRIMAKRSMSKNDLCPRMIQTQNFMDLKSSPNFSPDLVFTLKADSQDDLKLIKKLQYMNLLEAKGIVIEHMEKINEEDSIACINRFLAKSIQNPIEELILNSEIIVPFRRFSKGVIRCLKLVSSTVTLRGFKISEIELKALFEQTSGVKELCLSNCQIDISKNFRLSSKLDYQLQILKLDNTCRVIENDYLDQTKTVYFFVALSKIMKQLKTIYVVESQCPSEELQRLIDKLGFLASVVAIKTDKI